LPEGKTKRERKDGWLAVMSSMILNLDGQGNINKVQIIRAHRIQIDVSGEFLPVFSLDPRETCGIRRHPWLVDGADNMLHVAVRMGGVEIDFPWITGPNPLGGERPENYRNGFFILFLAPFKGLKGCTTREPSREKSQNHPG